MDGENLHPVGNTVENTLGEFVSSPPPADLPPQESQDSNILAMSGPFEPEMIANLPQMNIEQLSKLEEYISDEFAALAQEYVSARKPRVEYLQKSVESQIKKFQDNDASWSKFYNRQVQLIETLTYLTENNVIKENASSRHHGRNLSDNTLDFEADLKHLIETLESPLDFDDVFENNLGDLPFAEYFKEIIDLHKAQLVASLHHVQYQSGLTESLTEKSKVIFWKQCRDDVLQYKDKLINQTLQELESLHKEYYEIDSQANLANTNMHYYRSVVPVELSKSDAKHPSRRLLSTSNHDKFHGVDNVNYKNNRIEITDTKVSAQKSYRNFAKQQNKYKIPQLDRVSVKLAGCLGLTEEETDADLALMKPQNKISVAQPVKSSRTVYVEESDFSSDDHEMSSDEEDYHTILDINRQPAKTHAVFSD